MLTAAVVKEPRNITASRAPRVGERAEAAGSGFQSVAKQRARQTQSQQEEVHPRDVPARVAGSDGLLTPPNDDAPPPYGLHLAAAEEGSKDAEIGVTNGVAAPKARPSDASACPTGGALRALVTFFMRPTRAALRTWGEGSSAQKRRWAKRIQNAKATAGDLLPEPAQMASVIHLVVCAYGRWLPVPIRLLVIGTSEILCNAYNSILHHFNVKPFSEAPETKIDSVVRLSLDYQERERLRSYPKMNVMIITGANSGIGYEIAKAALKASYYVILACRSEIKALDAMRRLEMETGSHRVEFMRLDLTDLQSVEDFAAEIMDRSLLCNVLVNNAGIMDVPYRTTITGVESQMAVNHLGHFLLTSLLINNIAHAGGRIVNISSGAHYAASHIDYDNVTSSEKYSRLGNYAMSKLANIMFTASLASKMASQNVIVNTCHPGAVSTNLYANNPFSLVILNVVELLFAPDTLFRSPVRGAVTPIMLALHPSATFTGQYVYDERIRRPNPAALDAVKCETLWKWSEERTGYKFRVG